MLTDSMTFSRFLRESGEAVKSAENGTVRLQRRDGDDLILRTAERDGSERDGIRLAVAILERSLNEVDDDARTRLLSDVFPWVTFLPDGDRDQFASEVIESVRASTAIDRPDLISVLVSQWKSTAELWADPQLRARIESGLDPDGQVIPSPG
jgi:hypothetical protein